MRNFFIASFNNGYKVAVKTVNDHEFILTPLGCDGRPHSHVESMESDGSDVLLKLDYLQHRMEEFDTASYTGIGLEDFFVEV